MLKKSRDRTIVDKALSATLKVTLAYVIFAGTWIYFSDTAVEALISDPADVTRIQTIKGNLFVLATSVLLFALVLKNFRNVQSVLQLDGLTGLLNHHMFKIQLERRIARVGHNKRFIVGFMDVNQFGELNKSIGMERADEFLIRLARNIEKFAHPSSIIARLPPDQFTSAREFSDDENIDERVQTYQLLFDKTAEEMGIKATCSIGVAISPEDGTSANALMNAAEEALIQAKRSKTTIQYHDKSLTEQILKRRKLVDDLKKTIQAHAFTLMYQPKYDLSTKKVSGVEVLIRWNHPIHGAISPAEFIPLAEEYGLSHAITKFVVDRAANELERSGLLGKLLQHVSINVSAAEFNKVDEMENLLDCLNKYPLLPRYIRIEITETATLHDMKQSSAIIKQLQRAGLGFSVDDFGTGYTSLAMLKDLTIDEIKIDRSFVADLEKGGRSRTIVKAIIAMAKSFEINVVAEGVENKAQLAELEKMGCKEVQGYLLGRPMPMSDLVKHLAEPVLVY